MGWGFPPPERSGAPPKVPLCVGRNHRNSGTGWILTVGLNLRLSEAVDISTETCMKGCGGGVWDLQLQSTAVPRSCPGPVRGARVSTQPAVVGEML